MNFNTNAVTEPVTEAALISGRINNIAGNLINIFAHYARLYGFDAGKLRLKYGIIYLFLLVVNTAERYRSCHIRAVAADHRAEIHCYEVAAFNLLIGRHAVRKRRVFARNHNKIKGDTLAAEPAHIKLHIEHNFALGSALFNAGGYVFKGLIGQPLSLFH